MVRRVVDGVDGQMSEGGDVEAGGCLSTYLMAWDVCLFGDRWGVIWCCVCSVLRCVAWHCNG